MFRFNRLFLSLVAAQGIFIPVSQTWSATLGPYTPEANDQRVGAYNLSDGSTQTLSGDQQFQPGVVGTQTTSLGALQSSNRIVDDHGLIGAARLDPGPQNYGITIPDPTTGGNTTFQVYNPASLTALAPVDASTQVSDIANVGDGQYINARIGDVSNGTLNVNIGQQNALTNAASNGWSMAAKQSQLVNASGSGQANWNSNNRITFTGVTATPNQPRQIQVTNVASYKGAFSVTTLDGNSTAFNVTNATELKSYNNWLIDQLKSGNLSTSRYNSEFDKAFSKTNSSITYNMSASDPADDVAQPLGDRVVLNAQGSGAKVAVNAGKTLEVVGANNGAVRATNGGTAEINGKVSSTGGVFTQSAALELVDRSSGTNNGVINEGFLNQLNGTGVDTRTLGYNSNAVNVRSGSTFTNNGVVNLASTGNEANTGYTAAVNLVNARAVNNGNINVGVRSSSASGTTTGAAVTTADSSFTNATGGLIYLGRGPQNSLSETSAETALNQSGTTSGIAVSNNGTALNQGRIVIGSRVQNGAGMIATDGSNTRMTNSGVIDVNGAASGVPRENIGMSVLNAGSGGGISNSGTINLNGVNGIGMKVLSTGNNTANASSTGTINVAGNADPASGTRNFGVWVEGQGTGSATATVNGPVNLSGNGAIGVHARGNATVNVASNAVPGFTSGSNQIAFYAYGPDARINVLGNNDFDVTTTNSTLFRLSQGADFDGSGLALTASGEGSTGVLGTGTGDTQINTRGARFNVSGQGARGVVIEGGAQGNIDSATTLNLTGENATGAIVDGQKHTLTGQSSGSPVASTQLTSSAAISSGQNGLTGLLARNQAQLNNSGNINFTGAGSTAVRVESGATATNSGTLSVADGGSAIVVDGSGNSITTASNSGTLNVNGGSTASRTRGIVAQGSRAVASQNGTLNLNGEGATGAEALNGATVNVASGGVPVFNNINQIAYHAAGAGSTINSALNSNNVTTQGSTLYRIDDAAALGFSDGSAVNLSGAQSTGVIASGTGSQFNSGASQFTTTGDGATAVRVEGGASASLGTGSQLALNGNNSLGVKIDTLRSDLSNALDGSAAATSVTSQAAISGSGRGATGYDVNNGATLVNQGNISLSGSDNTGIRLRNGSQLNNSGAISVANGTGIDVSGSGTSLSDGGNINVQDGTAGVRLSDGASLIMDGSGTNIVTAGSAHGILLDNGAGGLDASDATLNVTGSGSGIENRAETSNVILNNSTINVANGSGMRTATPFSQDSTLTTNVSGRGTGLNFTQADGASSGNDLLLGSGYTFNVTGAGGSAIRANTTGNVLSAANINITNAAGGSAIVTSTASNVVNSGNIFSQSTAAPVIDLRGGNAVFENRGNIITPNPQTVAVAGGDGNDRFSLVDGDVVGEVNTGGGSDTLSFTGGTLSGSLTMGNGDNNQARVEDVNLDNARHITNGGGNNGTLTLENIQARGGSFSADDLSKGVNLGSGWSTINFVNSGWTLTDNLQLAHSTVNISSDATLYGGDGVNPVLSGGSSNSLVVNNAGIIDLTNGSGSPGNRLTINGDLASQGGTVKMNTLLNAGGPLSSQQTDRLLVNGNASGTTLLDVTAADGSLGALTDRNRNGIVNADEGISLAQVSGNASASSFALKGGYLSAGPWQYSLYSFEPGTSDASQRQVSGSQNWDYRLANSYVCSDGSRCLPQAAAGVVGSPQAQQIASSARPAVTPQVPSYISAPIGLAYYTMAITDDLHKRLGELRHQQNDPTGNGGEMFVRYIGSNLKYKSNVDFKNYGYDFDLDYSAVQLGGNLLRLNGEKDSLRGGVAYTRGNTRIRPHAADGYSSTTFDSDSLALYGTWQRDNGFYVDGTLSWDWHRGETDIAREKEVAKLKGKGWNASLETGYPFELGNGYRLEPQAQLMYMHLNMNSFSDNDHTQVDYNNFNQTIGRVGARLDRTWQDEAQRQYTPYLRANYFKGWGGTSKATVSSTDADISQSFNSGKLGQMWEVGVGGTTTFKNDVSLYAEADYRKEVEGNGARGWRYNAGVRWTF